MCKILQVVPGRVGFTELPDGVVLEEPDHLNGSHVKGCLRIGWKRSSYGWNTPILVGSQKPVCSSFCLPGFFLPFSLPTSFFPSVSAGGAATMCQVHEVLGPEGRDSLLHGILSSLPGMANSEQGNKQVNAQLGIRANARQGHTFGSREGLPKEVTFRGRPAEWEEGPCEGGRGAFQAEGIAWVKALRTGKSGGWLKNREKAHVVCKAWRTREWP